MNKMYNIFTGKKREISIFLYCLASVFLRYLCYGATYFYQLDDYIQYWRYPRAEVRWDVVMEQGLLCSRPLAGVSDIYFWGNFFDNLIVAVFIISVLYALSALLFLKVFKKYFKTGFMFVVFYSLMPFFFEGAYWVSASSRIVVGLFFTALSAWLLQRFFETQKKRYIAPFSIIQLISVCFYEQIFILSMVLSFGIIVFNSKDKRKNLLMCLVLMFNAVLYFAFTTYFSSIGETTLSNRMGIMLPTFSKWYFSLIADLLEQMKAVFWDVPWAVTVKGFFRGLKIVISDKLWIVIPTVLILGWASFVLCKREESYAEKQVSKKLILFVGIILAVLPLTLFFVLSNPYICMRNILPSFVGIALILDMVFASLARRKKALMAVLSACISGVFFISSVSELHDYKAVYDFDMTIGKNVVKVMEDTGYQDKIAFIIQGGDKGSVNARFHEHGAGVISSNWALNGLLNYLNFDNLKINSNAVPIETEDNIYHYSWDKDAKLLSNFEHIYYWRNDLSGFMEIYLNPVTDTVTELKNAEGGLVATIKEHNNIGYILYN